MVSREKYSGCSDSRRPRFCRCRSGGRGYRRGGHRRARPAQRRAGGDGDGNPVPFAHLPLAVSRDLALFRTYPNISFRIRPEQESPPGRQLVAGLLTCAHWWRLGLACDMWLNGYECTAGSGINVVIRRYVVDRPSRTTVYLPRCGKPALGKPARWGGRAPACEPQPHVRRAILPILP